MVASYDRARVRLVPEYEGVSFEQVHAPVLDLLPESAASVLDVGCGYRSGRRGSPAMAWSPWSVIGATRGGHGAARFTPDSNRRPIASRRSFSFDLIWLSAVWMHVPRSVPERLRPLAGPRPGDVEHAQLVAAYKVHQHGDGLVIAQGRRVNEHVGPGMLLAVRPRQIGAAFKDAVVDDRGCVGVEDVLQGSLDIPGARQFHHRVHRRDRALLRPAPLRAPAAAGCARCKRRGQRALVHAGLPAGDDLQHATRRGALASG